MTKKVVNHTLRYFGIYFSTIAAMSALAGIMTDDSRFISASLVAGNASGIALQVNTLNKNK